MACTTPDNQEQIDTLQTLLPDRTSEWIANSFQTQLQVLLGMLNLQLGEVEHTYTLFDSDKQNVVLPLPFTKKLISVYSEDGRIDESYYYFNSDLSMIRFSSEHEYDYKILDIKYVTEVSDDFIINSLYPIVMDMVRFDSLPETEKNLSSIKEGDVSLNFDTGNSLYAMILSRIDNLKLELTHHSAMIV